MSIPAHLISARRSMTETNDCVVIAVAVATGLSYQEVHKMFAKVGRTPRKCTSTWKIEVSLRLLGFSVEKLETWKGKTCKTFKQPFAQRGIVLTAGHAAGFVGGVVRDWTSERRHRIQEVWVVSKPEVFY